jgi:hypothetical protein
MPPLYEVLLLFSAPQGHLAEVRRLDQRFDAPKSKVYHWLWIEAEVVRTLRFTALTTGPRQTRLFEEAQLWFDDCRGELKWMTGSVVPLVTEPRGGLPQSLHRLVHQHLS